MGYLLKATSLGLSTWRTYNAYTIQPGTPRPLSPGQGSPTFIRLTSDGESSKRAHSPTLSQQINEVTSTNISSTPPEKAPPGPSPVAPLAPTPSKTTPEKLKITDFNILEDMGQGAYGQVKLARYLKGDKKGERDRPQIRHQEAPSSSTPGRATADSVPCL